ncbi:M16 family metallopeptidase [Gaopeijia maritima]|uniref:Pitrilysin family protein n=1 Tax=Gaopeijia maritima TaxID=3119007 RepID=A0ABU9EAY7_9BACT
MSPSRPRSAPGGRVHAALAAVLVALVASASPLWAQGGERLVVPPLAIDTFTLDNGLRVIVSEDHSTPIVAVEMWYHVGSAHEPEGRTGFAHLFEHLAFEHTEGMADGEFANLITRAGGVYNGETDADRTAFHEVLPANRVNLALWSHAERMARLRIGEDDFTTQRNVVKEERRLRVDNQPYAVSRLSLDSVAFRHYEPYRHSAMGSMDDLDSAGVSDARAFYERFYGPNHAVLAVVGAVGADDVRAMAEEYFGALERAPEMPVLPPAPDAPRTDGERRHEEVDPLAQLPLVWMAHGLPAASHPDYLPITLLTQILGTGESSRLRRRLVTEEGAALDVVAEIDRRRQAGMLVIGAAPNASVDPARLEALLAEELRLIASEGVAPEELEAARNQVLTGAVTERMTVASKASLLQRYTLVHGSPFGVNRELARFDEVTVDDLRRVAATYLTAANRTVVVVRPGRAAGAAR